MGMLQTYQPGPVRPYPQEAGIQAIVWRLWPWMNWLLPVFVCLHGWLGSGGWETLMLTLASPVIVPVTGLLGSLPRFVLRRRSHVRTPSPAVPLLFVNWWGWITFALAMPGAGDSGSIDSLLRRMTPAPLSQAFEYGILMTGAAAATLAWIAVLLIAFLAPPSEARREATLVGWLAALAAPALLVGAVILGVHMTGEQRDGGGETVREVQALSVDAQAERAEARYDQTHARLGEVRGLIAPDGWEVAEFGLDTAPYNCHLNDVECYGVVGRFQHPAAGGELDMDELAADLEAHGWRVASVGPDGVTATDADGNEVSVYIVRETEVDVSITTPFWWGDSFEIRRALDRQYEESVRSRTYAADEWPPLS